MIPDRKHVKYDVTLGLMESSEVLGSGTVDPRKVQHDYLTQPPMDISNFGCPSKRYHSIVQVSQEVLPTTGEAPKLAYPLFHCRQNLPACPPDSECNEEEEVEDVGNQRPSCSYIDMIRRALKSSDEGKMKLKEIYDWITSSYPYFRTCRLQWKNSVRHALSASKEFTRISSGPEWSRGGEWALASCASELKPSTVYIKPPPSGISMSWFREMDQNLDELNQVTYVYSDTFTHFSTEAKSPTPDPFALVEDECFSQSQLHDCKENMKPVYCQLDMPDLEMDTNLNELIFDGHMVKRKAVQE